MTSTRIALFASQGAEAERIADHVRRFDAHSLALHGDWGDPLPDKAADWRGDLALSYCSRWILPAGLLARAKTAVNFHPGPPEYPGVGGLNWALYNEDETFGVTAHYMNAEVDAGLIFEVRRFEIYAHDTVETLFHRTHLQLEMLAYDVIARLAGGARPAPDGSVWSARKRSRAELDALARIDANMSDEEIARRVRATEFRAWKPQIALGGYLFELKR